MRRRARVPGDGQNTVASGSATTWVQGGHSALGALNAHSELAGAHSRWTMAVSDLHLRQRKGHP